MNTLVIDIGGTHIKLWLTGEAEKIKVPSGPDAGPQQLHKALHNDAHKWSFDRVSIGYPGEVRHGRPVADPFNLASGWVDFDYPKAFGKPVKIMNDACMQALGSYDGGRMLFIGLGTSMGTVFISDGKIIPLALGHLRFSKRESFEHHLNRKGLKLYGPKKWSQAVCEAAEILKAAFLADYVILGGGNAKKLGKLPSGIRRGANEMAYVGGVRMWEGEFAEGQPVWPYIVATA